MHEAVTPKLLLTPQIAHHYHYEVPPEIMRILKHNS